MGWNATLHTKENSPYWAKFNAAPYFYFVHSYYPDGVDPEIVSATCNYGDETFCAAIEQGKLFATQFHPEKSQHAGLKLLENFFKA